LCVRNGERTGKKGTGDRTLETKSNLARKKGEGILLGFPYGLMPPKSVLQGRIGNKGKKTLNFRLLRGGEGNKVGKRKKKKDDPKKSLNHLFSL